MRINKTSILLLTWKKKKLKLKAAILCLWDRIWIDVNYLKEFYLKVLFGYSTGLVVLFSYIDCCVYAALNIYLIIVLIYVLNYDVIWVYLWISCFYFLFGCVVIVYIYYSKYDKQIKLSTI